MLLMFECDTQLLPSGLQVIRAHTHSKCSVRINSVNKTNLASVSLPDICSIC